MSEGEERKQILEMARSNTGGGSDEIDMAYLLQKLDGIENADERCIIATTNNPQKINPALIRPGRFDIKICLDNCTPQMCKDILLNYYKENKIAESKIPIFDFPDKKYSPLQLINLAMRYESIDDLLDYIYSNTIEAEVL